VNVHEFPHAGSEVNGGAAVGDFDLGVPCSLEARTNN
jgi:hypothetical protein